MIRARARWIEEGEKPSNYFCNLENRNFVSKRMVSLLKPNNEEITDFNSINKEVGNFYKNLYSCREESIVDVDLKNVLSDNTPKLSEEISQSIEGHITLLEATTFLSKMKNNKSPGSSGFTVEFFNFFWNNIKYFWLNSINYGFYTGELSITQREGIIVCIPKGDKCKRLIKKIGARFLY